MPFQNKESSGEEVQFDLIGGLGNQLFIYFASQYYTSKTGVSSSLNLSTIGSGGTDHGRSILDFDLQGNFIESKGKNPFSISARISNRIVTRIPKIGKIIQRNSRKYVSDVLGLDENLLKVKPGTTVHGYFQSWKYFENFPLKEDTQIRLVRYSNWYHETLMLMKSSNPVVIHVRIGDYQPLRETFGILGSSYYKCALERIDPDGTSPIWIFSDDIEQAKKLLSEEEISNSVFISPPEGTTPSESMMLMSHAERIIIGNSTFSWWAAMFGTKGKAVIYPKPWFKNSVEPLEMFPSSWTAIESDWW